MTTQTDPASFAASAFCANPPALPDSFVSRNFACTSRSIATFNSFENGPCIQISCFLLKPSSSANGKISGCGSTLAYKRSRSEIRSATIGNSFIPVVRKIRPFCISNHSAADSQSGNVTRSENADKSICPRNRRT